MKRVSGTLGMASGKIFLIIICTVTVTGGFTLGYLVGKNTGEPVPHPGNPVNDPASGTPPLNPSNATPSPAESAPQVQSVENKQPIPEVQQGTVASVSRDPLSQREETKIDTKPNVPAMQKGADEARVVFVDKGSSPSSRGKSPTEATTQSPVPQEPVREQGVDPTKPELSKNLYTVQAGAFKSQKDADALKKNLEKKGYKASVKKEKNSKGTLFFKVRVGEFEEKQKASVFALKLKKTEGLNAFATLKN